MTNISVTRVVCNKFGKKVQIMPFAFFPWQESCIFALFQQIAFLHISLGYELATGIFFPTATHCAKTPSRPKRTTCDGKHWEIMGT